MSISREIRRRVLVVAYYFPPLGLSGVQRTLKFVKYLPDYGWQPTVLTVEPGGYYAKDESLEADLAGRDITVIRTPSRDPLSFFKKKGVVAIPRESVRGLASNLSLALMQPDNKIGWKKFAMQAVDTLMRSAGAPAFDAVYATAPPYTDLLIGREIKRKYRIPLVVDYRDAWVGNPFNFYATPFHRAYAARQEELVLRDADKVVAVHRKIKELLITRYPFLGFEDVNIIPHGYDTDDFVVSGPLPRTEKMRFTYSGVFYEKRTPKFFLEALAQVFEKHPETRNRIEACFVGQFRKEHLRYIKKLGLTDAVNITGYLPHNECTKYLLASDVLWMMMFDTISTPGKVYEYIGARKPILACAPEGVVRQTLLESQAARVVGPTDVAAIAEAIYAYFQMWTKNALPVPPETFVQRFDRKELTWELAKVLESVAAL